MLQILHLNFNFKFRFRSTAHRISVYLSNFNIHSLGSRKCRWPIVICLYVSQSKFYSTYMYIYYVHQTYTMSPGGLCHWPTFYAWVTLFKKNDQVYIIMPRCTTLTKPTPHVHLYMIHQCHVVVCVLCLYFTFEWPWLGRHFLDHMSVPAGADPGIFVGGGGVQPSENFW